MQYFNKDMFEIIKELQDFSYDQQKLEEQKYQEKFWKNNKFSKTKVVKSYYIPQKVLRNATIISQLYLLGNEKEIIKILRN